MRGLTDACGSGRTNVMVKYWLGTAEDVETTLVLPVALEVVIALVGTRWTLPLESRLIADFALEWVLCAFVVPCGFAVLVFVV